METDFTKPTLEQALSLAPLLREADRKEVSRAGFTPERAIKDSYERSDEVWLVNLDGKPACLMGVGRVSILGNIGAPWFLTTNVMDCWTAKRALLKYSPQYISRFLERYDMLVNYVDADYAKALRWLQWLGFSIGEPQKTMTGAYFCEVRMERKELWAS